VLLEPTALGLPHTEAHRADRTRAAAVLRPAGYRSHAACQQVGAVIQAGMAGLRSRSSGR
jgi:hypothetical protein